MQDTDVRPVSRSTDPGPPPRRLVAAAIAVFAIIGLGVVIAVLAGGDSDPEAAAATATTTAATTTEAPTTTAATTTVAPTTQAPVTTTTIAERTFPVRPPERGLASMAYDAQSGALVMFGGSLNGYASGSAETWVFDHATEVWEQRFPETSPGIRYGAAAEYDAGLDRIVLFGGTADDSWVWDDLWLYDVDANTWEVVSVSGPKPDARTYLDMVYVDSLGGMLLYGGSLSPWINEEYARDTWLLDTSTMTWTEIDDASPGNELLTSLAYDPESDLVVLIGTYRSAEDPLWVFDVGSSTWVAGAQFPSAELSTFENPDRQLVYDRATGQIVAPGYVYDPASDSWTSVRWSDVLEGELVEAGDVILSVNPYAVWEWDLAAGDWRRLGMDS